MLEGVILTIIGSVVLGLLGSLTRNATAISSDGEAKVIHLGRQARGFALLILVAIFVSVPIVIWNLPRLKMRDGNDLAAWFGLGAVLYIAGPFFYLAIMRTRWVVTNKRITALSLGNSPVFIDWEDVEKVEWSKFGQEWIVIGRQGTKMKLPNKDYCDGLEWFAQACQRHLKPEQYPTKLLD